MEPQDQQNEKPAPDQVDEKNSSDAPPEGGDSPAPPQPPEGNASGKKPAAPRMQMNNTTMFMLLVVFLIVMLLMFIKEDTNVSKISYSFFREQLVGNNIAEVDFQGQQLSGKFKKPPIDPQWLKEQAEKKKEAADKPAAETKSSGEQEGKKEEAPRLNENFTVFLTPLVGEDLDKLLLEKTELVKSTPPTDSANLFMFIWLIFFVVLIVGFWIMMRRTREQFMGGGMFSGFIKSPAKKYDVTKRKVTFKDVAGLKGVKEDLTEIVEFLKNPEKFQRLGGRVPKGVLLMGPPGTGKTLLARAVAGEADVPFYSINGSEFIQMFVGVGASRVRDMFKTAKESAPAILFIDEIDAVGRQRGAGLGGGHDEREQTLNQILSEMDGFSPSESVIVIAATNRPDVLDPALLRPGRFDRHITVDRPTREGRKEVFLVHMKNVPIADNVDLDRLAGATVGLTGADIQNLVNEAALWATRHDKKEVEMSDFEYARDKILMGAKREEILTEEEKRKTAYHEAGHALLAWLLPGNELVHKVTVIPRGRALGVTQLLPEEDRMNIGEQELYSRLAFMLGGRAAEKIVFGEFSAGAENDLKQATAMARRMVSHWGMSEKLGPVAYWSSEVQPFLGKEIAHEQRQFSDHTTRLIDEEVLRILEQTSAKAFEMLEHHRDKLDRLADELCEREELDTSEIEELIGPSARGPISKNGESQGDDSSEKPEKSTSSES